MPMNRTDFANLIPEPAPLLKLMRTLAPSLMHCPEGHALPHRLPSGRCIPSCCAEVGLVGRKGRRGQGNSTTAVLADEMDLMPRGMEQEAANRSVATPEEAEEIKEDARERMALLKAKVRFDVKKALSPAIQDEPPPPSKMNGSEYIRERLKQAAPLALELTLHRAKYGTEEQSERATKHLLDLHKEINTDAGVQAPVIIIQGGFDNPFLGRQKNHGQVEAVAAEAAGAAARDPDGIPALGAGAPEQPAGAGSAAPERHGAHGGGPQPGWPPVQGS